MSQFYITNDSELDIQRCNESRHSQNAIVIVAQTIAGSINPLRALFNQSNTIRSAPQAGDGV